jgi:hypothetical protein
MVLFRLLDHLTHCFYAGSCLADCSATHARRILSEVLEKERNWLPILGVGRGTDILNS